MAAPQLPPAPDDRLVRLSLNITKAQLAGWISQDEHAALTARLEAGEIAEVAAELERRKSTASPEPTAANEAAPAGRVQYSDDPELLSAELRLDVQGWRTSDVSVRAGLIAPRAPGRPTDREE